MMTSTSTSEGRQEGREVGKRKEKDVKTQVVKGHVEEKNLQKKKYTCISSKHIPIL